jgi:hypothetical protein
MRDRQFDSRATLVRGLVFPQPCIIDILGHFHFENALPIVLSVLVGKAPVFREIGSIVTSGARKVLGVVAFGELLLGLSRLWCLEDALCLASWPVNAYSSAPPWPAR